MFSLQAGNGSAAVKNGNHVSQKKISSGGSSQGGFGADNHDDVDFDANAYAEYAGITPGEASYRFDAITDYTGNYYEPIRKSQKEGNDSSRAKNIEAYLADAKKYKGEVFRGVAVNSIDDFHKRYGDVGSTFQEKSMNSWSSSKGVAQGFADDSGRPIKVIFTTQNKTGASVKNISNFKHEDEVLVGKNAKYKIKNIDSLSAGELLNVTLEEL